MLSETKGCDSNGSSMAGLISLVTRSVYFSLNTGCRVGSCIHQCAYKRSRQFGRRKQRRVRRAPALQAPFTHPHWPRFALPKLAVVGEAESQRSLLVQRSADGKRCVEGAALRSRRIRSPNQPMTISHFQMQCGTGWMAGLRSRHAFRSGASCPNSN